MKPVFFVLCIVSLMFFGCDRKAAPRHQATLKLAHSLDVTHPVHRAMEFMAARVFEKSSGRIKVEIFPSEQLGNEKECIEALQLGYQLRIYLILRL